MPLVSPSSTSSGNDARLPPALWLSDRDGRRAGGDAGERLEVRRLLLDFDQLHVGRRRVLDRACALERDEQRGDRRERENDLHHASSRPGLPASITNDFLVVIGAPGRLT
jgi:hypothetical protein